LTLFAILELKLPFAVLLTVNGLAPQTLTDALDVCPVPVSPVEAVFGYVEQVAVGAVTVRE
jgi:hypothetical protein